MEIRARLRVQPEIQGGKIHHRAGPHDQGMISNTISQSAILAHLFFRDLRMEGEEIFPYQSVY